MQTETKPPLLKVGDKIYETGYYNRYTINNVLEIERTTKTQAIANDGTRFRLQAFINGRCEQIGAKSLIYHLETPELKERYEHQQAVSLLKNTNYSEFSITALRTLANIIQNEIALIQSK